MRNQCPGRVSVDRDADLIVIQHRLGAPDCRIRLKTATTYDPKSEHSTSAI
jgi:hypothetical protein